MRDTGERGRAFAPRCYRAAAVAHLYDLMLMLDPNVSDERQSEIVAEVERMLADGGTIAGAHDWGLRRMAYEIDHRPEAHYHLYQFEGENPLLERLRHSLRIMDGVLRFRIIRVKPGTPPPPPPRPQEPVRARREDEGEGEGRVAARAAADAP
jgi:small subunit ribosomal protein S6